MRDRLRVGPRTAPPGDRRAERVAARPPAAAGAILALQRGAGNQAVAQLMREPEDGAATAPLMLTDRPWAEIERERRDRMWGGILPGTQQPRIPGRSLPQPDMPRLLAELREPADEPAEVEAEEPQGPILLLTNTSWRQHEHDKRVDKARQLRDQRRRDRQAEIAAQQSRPRKATPRTPADQEAIALAQAEAGRTAAAEAREAQLAGERVAAARAHVAGVAAVVAALVPHVQPPNAVAASFMSAAEINQVAADLAQVQAQLAAIHAHDAVLAGHQAALAAPPVAQPTLAAAYTDSRTTFDVGALSAQVQATRQAHLTTAAVKRKVEGMLNAAKADPARLLGRTAANTILNAHAGKNATTITNEIATAVHNQHHPRLGKWLELLQITTMAKDGQLRIKKLQGIAPSASAQRKDVHLTLYINRIAAPVNGVNSTAAEVLDAVLPKHYPWGAHVTLEYLGPKAPGDNPHYYRDDVAAVRHSYPNDSTWPTVEQEMIKRLNDAIVELTVRIQGMLDRKGREIGDQ